jgi:23S rRNA (guanosine2251-2'-O)-methyltransferase
MTRSLEQLKQRGIWCVGLDERGTMNYDDFDYTANCILVLGREGAGLHDLVRKTCDQLLRIPMAGAVSSLNVSVAGAVVLYEAARQRRAAALAETSASSIEPAPKPRKQKGLGSVASESDYLDARQALASSSDALGSAAVAVAPNPTSKPKPRPQNARRESKQ